jgi:archaellum component FlaC
MSANYKSKELNGLNDSKFKYNNYPLYHQNLETKLDNLSQQKMQKENELQTKVTEQEIDCLKHDILYLAKEIKTTAKETSRELNQQGEVISKMDPKLNRISDNLEKSDTLVSIIRNKFNKFAFWKTRRYSKQGDIDTLPSQVKDIKKTVKYSANDLKPKEEYVVGRKANDDEFFDILIGQLKDIQSVNNAIGKEIDAQTNAFCKMNKKVDTSNKNLDDLNRNVNQLIR